MFNFHRKQSKKTLSFHYSTHRRICQYICVVLALFAFFFTTNSANAAGTIGTNNFYFKDFTADYYLTRDTDGTSRMKVIENLTAVFPETNQNHGITRVIPFTNNDGKNLTMKSDLFLDIKALRNGEHEPVAKTEVGNGYFTVYIGDKYDYVHGEQKYTLVYEFENVILNQTEDGESWQELYWDTNGNDWQQKFNKVTARIHFDEATAKAYDGRYACFVGKYGSANTSRCEAKLIEDGVEFSAKNLASRENLTFVLGFEANAFKIPEPRRSYVLMGVTIVVILLTFITIIFAIITYYGCNDKRKYYKSLFIKPEYTPPKGYTVAEMAANFIGKGGSGNPKVATLLELAVTHKIEIIKATAVTILGRNKDIWKVKVLKTDLTRPQELVLKILAKSSTSLTVGQEIIITDKTSSVATTLSTKYDKELKTILEDAGLTEPKKAKKNHATALIAVSVIWVMALCFGMILLVDAVDTGKTYIEVAGGEGLFGVIFALILLSVLVSTIIGGTSQKYYKHTKLGLEMSRYLDGLRLYISMAEADRLKFLQSTKGASVSNKGIVKLYEKLLPYASFFALEKSWLDAMGKYYEMKDVSEPTWYVGVGAFSASEFSRAMRSVSTSANSSIVHSSPSGSSSGGSGFSGGGFSGGGGGGGGGGGW